MVELLRNGSSLVIPQNATEHIVTSDALGAWGCRAWHKTQWFQIPWDKSTQSLQIAIKEMIPIIVAVCIWGHKWSRRKVIARCDNTAVVAVLSHCYSKDYVLMQLMRCLFFIEAVNSFQIQGQHIPGSLNSLADNLPKNKSDKFYSKMPCHAPHASKLPQPLWPLCPAAD